MNANTLYEGPITLGNGRHLHIRALRRGEAVAVRELFARLSPRTRYLRFHSPLAILPDSLPHLLIDVDDSRRLALVAQLADVPGGDIVGLGNLIAGDDDRAELGVVVADAWQRQGLGVALAAGLLHAAEVRGCRRFVMYGFWGNPAVRPLLSHIADVTSTNTRFGVSEITFVRRRPMAMSARAASHEPKTSAKDPLERAYERILAAKGCPEKW
jgi:GNAT superfamily N-acetyltransferase